HQQNRGPRSLVTRQPLRGRSQGGCQRYGNMEIEAAIAHGLAANLMELTGAKSDDIHESHRLQNALTFSERPVRLRNSNKPESFNMTIQYLRAIGFDIQATDYYDKEIDFYKYFAKKIKQISHGEITNPKTINARTFKPEAGRESEGLLCDHCGGKIEEKDNQRWRPAHYHLAIPVTNMLIFKSHVTQLSKLLKIPSKKLEDIIYFRVYVVLDNGLSNLVQKKTLLTKKVDSLLISSLLDEIIANSTEQSSVVKEVQVLQTKLTSQEETDMIFWEDYWDFIAQHLKIKMATGSEALR
ncbi:16727_t:CDS:2, partial [Racocetra persica]